ncbi:cytochrome c-type biogenesis protein [Actinobacillus pleuropneumoniae serovar 3 str. JL03]|uniref:Cytochrome c-type biogenesis protein n=4 Tax=Actinobacillus pleuropneumoniae TaxID=715 RepID=B0BQV6_ACTPJ|nr:heme lyase CcmF/NrfE family subunit [Actinobacillus pleuropneumoniae]ABY69941.1 cytochrome c-type biogenesis protein [Actinobacillus pleuropneumoniae serovar 3 str. JL03]EFM96001.1 Cytochrome c-type bioproteinsis protein ccmF [Actinobacillus pleuropneumoniae serovar 10 str. D13039]UKH14881.1 heme lyase CcmF/NrfE family subunit [Actinobacillus pleuropneumoniae]UKH23052.1 heme lyase CcmF/NrfE family subunit [Actinobacillus pleuropneumoniae]UKH33236.1 heme lyase CcmF/NrfE family subunit [Actin
MVAELGNYALALAFGLSIFLAILPLVGAQKQNSTLMALARPITWAMFLALTISFGSLFYLFAVNDFSVQYVVNNSNSTLPIQYRLSAVWGSHEGSMLLWVWLLSLWSIAVAAFSRQMPEEAVSRVLSVMGLISIGFLVFLIFSSNPFKRTFPDFPADGRELNPMLQDVGLIFHPPLLYMGYVGFSVAFAFAIASLMTGRLDTAWARWSRLWTMAAWVFLTLGIVLGSWWAYYELGWGGWWFWDPVENASLMPWIAGTALIHSLAVTEKRGTFKAWTVLLAILAFSLCLLGTFLVRSGILVSVHAFASDPTRGLYILAYLVLVIGGSLLLYALQGSKIKSLDNYERYSRESMLLINNVMLMAFLSVVLLGTLLPLVHKQIGLGTISIGAPFFDQMFLILMVPFSFILGIGPLVKWRRDQVSAIRTPVIIALIMMVVLGFGLPYLLHDRITATSVLGVMMASIIVILSLYELHQRATHRHSFLAGVFKLSRSHWGMVLAHVGVAMTVFGIAFSQNYSVEKNVRMNVGDTVSLQGYDFTFKGIKITDGANYQGGTAEIEISRQGQYESTLNAEKRFYNVSKMGMTEAAIDWGFRRDLYAALGEKLEDGSWGVRLYYKPFVRWIWIGGLFMVFGGLLCMFDKRYRLNVVKKAA